MLPGWGGGDRSTIGIRSQLSLAGHPVHRWHLGRNEGASPQFLAALDDRLHTLAQRYERPIALVGWSLGGVHAWELAKRHPGDVQQVVTLGSPLRSMTSTALPASVPLTSIWSRHDRIVNWTQSSIDEGPLRQNIEVRSTHATLGFDPLVSLAIADRLSQTAAGWKPFRRPGWLARAYPAPGGRG